MNYKEPIAKPNEDQYGCILRNKKGTYAGFIAFRAKSIVSLSKKDQQEVVDFTLMLYEKFSKETKLKASQHLLQRILKHASP